MGNTRQLATGFFGVITLLLFAFPVHAESVQWNNNIGSLKYTYLNRGYLNGVQVGVTYNVRVINADTGEVLPSGASVKNGTNVNFEFIPHVNPDIYWFASGNFSDSPYGEWTENAAPPGNTCQSSNWIFTRKLWRTSVSYTVAPPAKSIQGTSAFASCTKSGSDDRCKLTKAGTFPVSFDFAETPGNLWGALGINSNCATPSVLPDGAVDPSFPVPPQTIPYTLTVVVSNETPTAPDVQLPGEPAVTNGACVVGQPFKFSMTSTDPKEDTIRYGIDWDANNRLDQFVPSTGYVPSGTTLTANRTFATTGLKTVKILAQNSKGLTSGWTTVTFSCAAKAEDATVGLNVNQAVSGINDDDIAALPDASLRLVPSLVRRGASTKVTWSATNVKSCTVTAPNGDSWDSILSPIGGETSKPITEETVYTLACLDLKEENTLSKKATVRVIPEFQEK